MGLSTHILDTGLGKPAPDVSVQLWRRAREDWLLLGQNLTDADGRCRTLLGDEDLQPADYRLRFDTGPYFAAQGLASLYPFIEITFTVTAPGQHHHIPLLLAANGYTTYRGS